MVEYDSHIKAMKKIVITGEKGGVGKSTITCLLTEWLLHNDHVVKLIDADPNETTREWVESCAEVGRRVSFDDSADYQVVDTAGRSGGGLRFVDEADLILAPFQPLAADVSRMVTWFMALHPRLQRKVAFIPNRVRAASITTEQRAGLGQIERLIAHEGNGHLIEPGLIDRPAVYPVLLEGSAENFFVLTGSDSLKKAQRETAFMVRSALDLLTNTQ